MLNKFVILQFICIVSFVADATDVDSCAAAPAKCMYFVPATAVQTMVPCVSPSYYFNDVTPTCSMQMSANSVSTQHSQC